MRDIRFIAVDLGGTQIRAARYTVEGVQEARVAMPTGAERGVEGVLQRIYSAIRQVWPPDLRIAGIGVGAPGFVDGKRGRVRLAKNLPGWYDVPLGDRLLEEFHVPVFLGNDANVAALGEHRFGAGCGVSSLVYLTVSTGIGGGVIVDNKLLTGEHGLGGEIGHMTIDVHGPRCACGNIGCVEALASGQAIARRAQEALAAGQETLLRALVGPDRAALTAQTVGQAALQGDPLACSLFIEAGHYLGAALVNLMVLLEPELLVLGGGVLKVGDLILDPIKVTAAERVPEIYRERMRIVPALLQDDVGLWGALALVLSELDL